MSTPRRVLVTGSSGFVGSALARSYGVDDFVVSVTRDRTRVPPGNVVVYGDVTDQDFCRRILADYEIDTIHHLAAQSIVSVCAEDPLNAIEIAVMGTARLLQAARDVGRPVRVVVMTSDKVYGHAKAPYTEETPLDARHAYEVSKANQDCTARMFAHNYGLDVRVVRAVNIYGPGDPNDSRVIPKTIRRALQGQPPELHAGAGEMRRQYIYIDDLVMALRHIADLPIDQSEGQGRFAYCVGSMDVPLSVRMVMRGIIERLGIPWQEPEIKARDDRFQEIDWQAVDDTKLRSTGWSPKVGFREGIARTIQWYKDIA